MQSIKKFKSKLCLHRKCNIDLQDVNRMNTR